MLWALGGVFALAAAVTFTAMLPVAHGLVRVCDLPRQQLAGTALLGLALCAPFDTSWRQGLAVGFLLVLALQLPWIARFTPLWRAQARRASRDAADRVRIVVYNVKMSNTAYTAALEGILAEEPDLILLVETDTRWSDAVRPLHATHPHRVLQPQDNGYGMVLYSTFPLDQVCVEDLLVQGIPSIRCRVTLPSGLRIRLYALHPEPPVPHLDSVGRDAEIGLVGRMVHADPLPSIVTGDLNDVGWSSTTRRFQRLSGLIDPRVGRGFFNSFHAQWRLLRWPLDHLFHDRGFGIVRMARMPDLGSDHFPMLFELAWLGGEALREPEPPTETDLEVVDELVELESSRERSPIGEDWER